METMFDTHAVARSLTEADFTNAQADVLTDAIASAARLRDHVTPDQLNVKAAELRTEIAGVRTEIAELDARLSKQIANLDSKLSTAETRLSWRMLGIAGLIVAALRLLN